MIFRLSRLFFSSLWKLRHQMNKVYIYKLNIYTGVIYFIPPKDRSLSFQYGCSIGSPLFSLYLIHFSLSDLWFYIYIYFIFEHCSRFIWLGWSNGLKTRRQLWCTWWWMTTLWKHKWIRRGRGCVWGELQGVLKKVAVVGWGKGKITIDIQVR